MFQPIFFQDRPLERRNGLALADDVERHTLPYFALRIAIRDNWLVAVRVHVDIARRDHIAFGRNGALSRFRVDLADARDLAVLDCEVTVKPRIARAVDQPSAMNNDVELSHCGLL